MMSALGSAISAPPVLAQLFPDVGGYLFGTEFLAVLAELITALLTSWVSLFLTGFLGMGG